jgi:molybdopterin molybdotransferase
LDNLLSVTEAKTRLVSAMQPVGIVEVPLSQAFERVLARPVISSLDQPPFDNSSMDGYAVRAADLAGAAPDRPAALRVVADIPAGVFPAVTLASGQAARIMTGAALPPGADAVVPVEQTDQYAPAARGFGAANPDSPAAPLDWVRVFQPVPAGAYIRGVGMDLRAGTAVLAPGRRLAPQDIALLASIGAARVSVFRAPAVAILSTGSELTPPDQELLPGRIYDSNSTMLQAMCLKFGARVVSLESARDDPQDIQNYLDRAVAAGAEMIVSSAGVSVGVYDYMKAVVERHGSLAFWRVNIRPGKPIAFGSYLGVPFIGLPGNPVSAFVCGEVFLRPALAALAGESDADRPRLPVTTLEPIESDGRESYLRAISTFQFGAWTARLAGHQGSGNIYALARANSLLIVPSGVKSLPAGSLLDAWLLT